MIGYLEMPLQNRHCFPGHASLLWLSLLAYSRLSISFRHNAISLRQLPFHLDIIYIFTTLPYIIFSAFWLSAATRHKFPPASLSFRYSQKMSFSTYFIDTCARWRLFIISSAFKYFDMHLPLIYYWYYSSRRHEMLHASPLYFSQAYYGVASRPRPIGFTIY